MRNVVIGDCTGAAGQQWTMSTTGELIHTNTIGSASEQCLTIPGADTTKGTDTTLAPCNASLEQQWTFADETTYLYDADGNRVLATTAGSRTLHLGEAELSVDANGRQSSVQRSYSHPGAPTVLRTKNNDGPLFALITDHHGTPLAEVSLTAGQQVTKQKTDPFGVDRGTQAAAWRNHRGYIGGTDDYATGLTHLGAREYDPAVGRFISADPILDITDPRRMNGYAYSRNNPITNSDPSGLIDCRMLPPEDAAQCGGWPTSPPAGGGTPTTAPPTYTEPQIFSNEEIPGDPLFLGRDLTESEMRTMDWYGFASIDAQLTDGEVKYWLDSALFGVEFGLALCQIVRGGFDNGCSEDVHGKWVSGEIGTRDDGRDPVLGFIAAIFLPDVEAHQKCFQGSAADCGWALADWLKIPKIKMGRKTSGSCSFLPGAHVLMADGTTKPIEDLKPGDQVLATDPGTGETTAKTVTATITTTGDKKFTQLALDTGDGTVQLTATDNHPFWVPEVDTWLDAGALEPGQWLRTSDGTHTQIAAITDYAEHTTTHNLTVEGIHTYYVLAGDTPVLVHNSNCNSLTRAQADDIARYLGYTKTNKLSAGKTPIWENKKARGGQPKSITFDRTGHHKEAVFKGSNDRNPFQSTKDSARDGTYGLDTGPNGELMGLKWLKK
jgi:RHS repeat-associated protein